MKTYKNVDEYIQKALPIHQEQLREVRNAVLGASKDIVESIAYGMPAYSYKEKPLFYFAAMKGHLGLYPTPGPITALASELTKFSTSKGCVRVPYSEKVPTTIIAKLIKERMREIKNA